MHKTKKMSQNVSSLTRDMYAEDGPESSSLTRILFRVFEICVEMRTQNHDNLIAS